MRLLVNKRLHVNMGNYEHMETTATVEIDTEKDEDILAKYEVASDDLESLEIFINEEINNLLHADVEDAHFMTAEEDSFIHEYYTEHKKGVSKP